MTRLSAEGLERGRAVHRWSTVPAGQHPVGRRLFPRLRLLVRGLLDLLGGPRSFLLPLQPMDLRLEPPDPGVPRVDPEEAIEDEQGLVEPSLFDSQGREGEERVRVVRVLVKSLLDDNGEGARPPSARAATIKVFRLRFPDL